MKKSFWSLAVGVGGAILLSMVLFPVVFGKTRSYSGPARGVVQQGGAARSVSHNTGGPEAKAAGERRQRLAKEIYDAVAECDFDGAERLLNSWEKSCGNDLPTYWTCVLHVRLAQDRLSDAADIYRRLDSYDSTVKTSAEYVSGWASICARAGRLWEVPELFERLAATEEFQKDPVLVSLPLARLARERRGVQAVEGLVAGSLYLRSGYGDKAEDQLKKSIGFHSGLAASHLLMARALREQGKTKAAQESLRMVSRLANSKLTGLVAEEDKAVQAALRRTALSSSQ